MFLSKLYKTVYYYEINIKEYRIIPLRNVCVLQNKLYRLR
jgi:hypothetical protein